MENNQSGQKKREVEVFFDDDAIDYMKYKYQDDQVSYMSVRQKLVIEFIEQYVLKLAKDTIMVLDAGCGPGLLIEDLNKYNVHCFGFDISINMLKLAHTRLSDTLLHGKCILMRADIENIPIPDKAFDLVISLGVIEYLDDDAKALSEFYRILKPGGYFLTAVTNKYSYNLMFDNIIEYFKKRRIISEYLSKVKIKMNMGKIMPREFTIRKYSPYQFQKDLARNNLKIIRDKFFGFNALPYPFNLFLGESNRVLANMFNKYNHTKIRFLGEGYLVLCQKT